VIGACTFSVDQRAIVASQSDSMMLSGLPSPKETSDPGFK
jgi:hypothetical protein